jgi:GH25 family lysozyme M1 (1,4-beta-N-acetylmuramidase)
MRLRPSSRLMSAVVLVPLLSASAVSAASATASPTSFGPASFDPEAVTTLIDGPDVSSYQHSNGVAISWPSVRKSGREFAIVKATEGTSYVNPWFARDYAGINAAAMVRGSYHFARPAHPIASTALAQAKFYVARLGDVTATRTLPPALDLENTGGLNRAELVVWAQDFLLDVRHLTGRTPMIYSYPYFWQREVGDAAALARYPLWMASYSGAVDPSASLWQYTASAAVSGIRGGVDMSRLTAGTQWTSMSDGALPSPWPVAAPGPAQRVVTAAGVRSATVSWLPGDAGSSAVAGYVVGIAETGQKQSVGPLATHAVFNGLTTGRAYTMTVTARNAVGSGPTTSRTVVPVAPTSLVTRASSTSIYVGKSVTYVGTLRNSDTVTPLVGYSVQVFTRALGASKWSFLRRVSTDASGQVQLTVSPTRSLQVRMYYPGNPTEQWAASSTTTPVRTRISAHLSHPIAAVGVPIVVYGTIYPHAGGILISRQVWTRDHWVTVATTRTKPTGSYGFLVTPGGRSTTHMRTVVAANHGRALGYSIAVTLSVR